VKAVRRVFNLLPHQELAQILPTASDPAAGFTEGEAVVVPGKQSIDPCE